MKQSLRIILILLVGLQLAVAAEADREWEGDVSAAWGEASDVNWNGGSAPDTDDRVIFSDTDATGASVTLGADRNIGRVQFNNKLSIDVAVGNALIIAGATNPDVDVLSGSHRLRCNVTLGAAAGNIVVADGATLTIDGILTLGANTTIQVGTGATVTLTGGVSGAFNLTKTGAGTLILSGSNSYGDTTISAGTLRCNSANTLPGGTALTVDGTLDLQGFSQTVGSLIGAGNVTSSASAATLTLGGSTTTTFSGQIANGNALVRGGTGILILSSVQSAIGAVTINSGATLRAGIADVLPATTALAVLGTLDLDGQALTLNSITGAGTITSSSACTLTINTASGFNLGCIIAGSTALTKTGTGTLELSNANAYTGATTVSAGNLRVAPPGNLSGGSAMSLAAGTVLDLNGLSQSVASLTGAGQVSNSGAAAVLTINGSGITTFSGPISGVGVTLAGTTELTFSTAQTYVGATTIGTGCTLKLGAANGLSAASAVTVTGTLNLQGNNLQLNSLAGAGSITSTGGTLTVSNALACTFSGTITGALGLSKQDVGILTLSGGNTYSGPTAVSAGTVRLGASNALPTGTVLTLGGTLDLATFNQTVASLSGSGPVSNGGTLTVSGANTTTYTGVIGNSTALTLAGTTSLTLTTVQTYTGTTSIGVGCSLRLGTNNALPSTAAVVVDGTLDLLGNVLQLASLTGGGGSVTSSGGALTLNNNANISFNGLLLGALSLTKQGTGVFTLLRPCTYSGSTLISAGTIQLASAGQTLPITTALTVNGTGSLDLNGRNQTVASLAGNSITGTVTNTAAATTVVLTVSGSLPATTFAGQLDDVSATQTLGLALSGSTGLTLSAAQDFRGPASVGAGCTLNLGGQSLTLSSLTGGGTITSIAGTLTLSPSSTITFDGVIAGTLALTKNGTGTLVLTGGNTYSGDTTVSTGTLRLAGGGRLGDAVGNTIVTGTLELTDTVGLPLGEDISLGGTILVSSNANRNIAGDITLSANATLNNAGSGLLQLSGAIGLGAFNLQCAAGNGRLTGIIGGTGGLAVNAGVWELTAANTLSGATTIAAGATLTVSGAVAAVTVDGLLEGIGSCAAVTVSATGTVAPGINPTRDTATVVRGGNGSLSVASLTLQNGASLDLDLGLASDRVACSGLFTAGTTTINLNGLAGYSTTTYILVDAGSSSVATATFTTDQRTGLASAGDAPKASMLGDDLAIVVDNTAPQLVRITAVQGSGTYFHGDTIDVQLEFDEPVQLTGNSLNVTLNTQPTAVVVTVAPTAFYANVLTASYTIAYPRYTVPAVLGVSAITRNPGAVLSDQQGNDVADATLNNLLPTLPGSSNLNDLRAIVIDNEAPQQIDAQVNALLNVGSIGSAVTLQGQLGFTDREDVAAVLVYTIKLLSSAGVIERWDGVAWTALGLNGTFTSSELVDAGFYGGFTQAGRVRYQHTGATAGNDAFGFTVRDGQTPERTSALTAKSITVVGNAAPVIPDQAIVLAPGLTISGQLQASDPEAQPVIFSYPNVVTQGVFTAVGTAGAYTYRHTAFNGVDDVLTVQVTDGSNVVQRDIPIIIYSTDALTPRFTSAPPMRAERPLATDVFNYSPTAARAPGATPLSFRLVTTPQLLDGTPMPADNPATPAVFEGFVFSSTTGAITWPSGAPAWGAVTGGYIRFGIMVIDSDNRRAGYQPVLIRVVGDPG